MIKDLKAKVISKEAYASTIYLNSEFFVDGVSYTATAVYYNGEGINSLEVYKTDDEEAEVKDYIVDLGYDIVSEIEVEKHLTC